MAYKSQVSQKWFGSTDKGKVALLDPRKTEMSQIVSALRNDFTPAMNKFSEKYIEDKQTTASARMTELYASGMKTEDIENAILEGFEPSRERDNTYIFLEFKELGRLGKKASRVISSSRLECYSLCQIDFSLIRPAYSDDSVGDYHL